ncbi:MAG: hypothetical protein AAF517_21020, partial [Planctomycetota bacterium]
MNVTLVAFYGSTSDAFSELAGTLQSRLCEEIGDHFRPYPLEQVHCTVVGLESERREGEIFHTHGETLDAARPLDLAGLWAALETHPSVDIQFGGFRAGDTEFLSRGEAPYLRSVSIGAQAVAMGWARKRGEFADWRRSFESFGVRHKWHRAPSDRDDDVYFVLGSVDESLPDGVRARALTAMRDSLAERRTEVVLSGEDLSFVRYRETTLDLA